LDEATQMVKNAWEAGINFIDTADLYTQGVSEIMVGKALKDLTIPRHAIILATKANGRMDANEINAAIPTLLNGGTVYMAGQKKCLIPTH